MLAGAHGLHGSCGRPIHMAVAPTLLLCVYLTWELPTTVATRSRSVPLRLPAGIRRVLVSGIGAGGGGLEAGASMLGVGDRGSLGGGGGHPMVTGG